MSDMRKKARARGIVEMPAPPSFTKDVKAGDSIQGEIVDVKQATHGFEGREPNWCIEIEATNGLVKGAKAESQQFVWSGQRHMGYLIRTIRPCIGDDVYIECVADDPKKGIKYLMEVEKTHKSVRYIGPSLLAGEMPDEPIPSHDVASPDEGPAARQGELASGDDDEDVHI